MNFGQAIEQMKQGKKCARSGWNGKGMFVFLWHSMPAEDEDAEGRPAELKKRFYAVTHRASSNESLQRVPVDPYFVMFTAQKTLQPGWLASQSDILAEDWTVVE